VRIHKKASQAVQDGASHRLQIQKNIVAITAVVAVLIMFWLSAVPALNWLERTGDAAVLRDARELWRQADIRDYEFSYNIACLCDDSTTAPVTVVVQNNEFVRAFSSDSNERLDISMLTAVPRTMTEVFDHISRLLASYPDAFEADYDASHGYPTVIRIDPDTAANGDESGYYVSDFRATAKEAAGE
jgi:hypothetical protein